MCVSQRDLRGLSLRTFIVAHEWDAYSYVH